MRQWPIPEECFDTDNGRLLPWTAERTAEVLAEWHTSPEVSTAVIAWLWPGPVNKASKKRERREEPAAGVLAEEHGLEQGRR